jgi:type III pantothenate kinase
MYLLIDAGNTRVKWALIESQLNNDINVFYGSLDDLAEALRNIDATSTKVLLSAVNQTDDLILLLKGKPFSEIIAVKSMSAQAGVTNSYQQPERLGVDRWLAMIASYKILSTLLDVKGVVVIDAGTALTIDVVNRDGMHQGGYIVPGMAMAQAALFTNAEQVKRYDEVVSFNSDDSRLNKLGNNTLQCVEYGVINQQVALIEKVTHQYPEYEIIITGGDCELLAGFFTTAKVDKNLVLKGLWQVRN